ncbi:MAG: YggS family pyridoxal phosphate-dependent enzyme [Collinsella sp.]
MDNYLDLMRARREQILERFYAALDRAGRPHDAARLIAVSKTVGVDETVAAIQGGVSPFCRESPAGAGSQAHRFGGASELPEVRFDMIGNLQTNKINAVLGSAELIHSVGSLHLAQAISSRAARKIEAGELAGPQRVLIEVNVSGEESKGGFSPDEIRAAAGELAELEGICVQGLMTMAPRGNKDVARRTFAGLRELRDELEAAHPDLNLPELSCGMSEDFEPALEEGSTLVRLGRVVFSPEFAVK